MTAVLGLMKTVEGTQHDHETEQERSQKSYILASSSLSFNQWWETCPFPGLASPMMELGHPEMKPNPFYPGQTIQYFTIMVIVNIPFPN